MESPLADGIFLITKNQLINILNHILPSPRNMATNHSMQRYEKNVSESRHGKN